MAGRRKDPRPARAYISLVTSDPERWSVQVTHLGVLSAHGEGFLLDTTRKEPGPSWSFPSQKKLIQELEREGFVPTGNWQYWERPVRPRKGVIVV